MLQHLILVINCGSSSLKFALYESNLGNHSANQNSDQPSPNKKHNILAEGLAESLNQSTANISIKYDNEKHETKLDLLSTEQNSRNSHDSALKYILQFLEKHFDLKNNLVGVGHRVVHGGPFFKHSVHITTKVLEQIEKCIPLAPLHNPANITGIKTLQQQHPGIPQVAVFDTAFHQSMPDKAFTYALPYTLYENEHVRRYGFHGSSHRYITLVAAKYFEKPPEHTNLITAHLGNGASVASISNGKSVDTSMGMTPLEGLVMGTRCGDLDPGIFDFLIAKGYSPAQISTLLNKESGLLGISGIGNDMRTICEHAEKGHRQSQLALDVFCFRAAKHIAAMMISLDKLDALVFTGGIGENSSAVRSNILKHLNILGFSIEKNRNEARISSEERLSAKAIHNKDSRPVLIIPTDEESMIVQDTINIIQTLAI